MKHSLWSGWLRDEKKSIMSPRKLSTRASVCRGIVTHIMIIIVLWTPVHPKCDKSTKWKLSWPFSPNGRNHPLKSHFASFLLTLLTPLNSGFIFSPDRFGFWPISWSARYLWSQASGPGMCWSVIYSSDTSTMPPHIHKPGHSSLHFVISDWFNVKTY